MLRGFELFVAGRYLRNNRKETVVPVITVISVAGVAAGVMALVIALAVNNGFRNTLQKNLLGATAHVNLLQKETGEGMPNWRELDARLKTLPHVIAVAPVLYGEVFLTGNRSKGAILKGIRVNDELAISDTLRQLKSGTLEALNDSSGLPGIVVGARLASDIGLQMGSVVTVIAPQGTPTPFGPTPSRQRFRVAGIFESGFYDFDDNWAYVTMQSVQRLLSLGDVVNAIEIQCDDLYRAPEVGELAVKAAGPSYTAVNWQDQNKQLLHALKMERAVTVITIGLIELIAGLNILITLTMVVLTKYKDIAVLIAMGARRKQIARIFMLQGLLIGLVGTAVGLTVGYTLCYFANAYHWVQLDESIYALSFVPFEPRPVDAVWIAAASLLWSLVATLYPARNATRITPVEVLRYE